MALTIAGSISLYMRNLKLQTQWNQKKESGNYTEKTDSENDQRDGIKSQLEALREEAANKDQDKERIMTKIKCGKKLTAGELEYIRQKDQAAYRKAKEIQAERESFEKELKECKTKEDFQRLKSIHLSTSLARVNEVMHNPVIPKGKKLEIALVENAKASAIQEVSERFIKSGKYDELPSQAEQNQEDQEINEAQKDKFTEEDKTVENREDEAVDGETPGRETMEGGRPGDQKLENEGSGEEIAKTQKPAVGTVPSESNVLEEPRTGIAKKTVHSTYREIAALYPDRNIDGSFQKNRYSKKA